MGFEPRPLWPCSLLFLLHNNASFRLIPHWYRNISLFLSFPVYISKCNHSPLCTVASIADSHGQGVPPCYKTLPFHLAAPIFFHALPSRLAFSSNWKCYVCTEAALFLLVLLRLKVTNWSLGPSKTCVPHVPSTIALPLSRYSPCPGLSHRVCCGGAELERRNRNRCLGVNWPRGQYHQPDSTVSQASRLWGRGHSRVLNSLWIIHECTPPPVTITHKSQIKFFSSPEKDPINIPGVRQIHHLAFLTYTGGYLEFASLD